MDSVISVNRTSLNTNFPTLHVRNIPIQNISHLDEYENSLPLTEQYYF